MDSKGRRSTVRSFLQAAVTAQPRTDDFESAGLSGPIEKAARRWVAVIRKAARPAPGARDAQTAAALVDEATDALAATLPDGWEAPREDPTALADRVKEVTI